jgi:hypothetical protein
MLVKMWSNRNSHSLLLGMQNGTDTLEDSLAVSYKAKHGFTIWSSYSLIFTQRSQKFMSTHKPMLGCL